MNLVTQNLRIIGMSLRDKSLINSSKLYSHIYEIPCRVVDQNKIKAMKFLKL